MSKRARNSAATQAIILAAARDLFTTRGVHGTSIRQIAARAGVDHALVLRYFGDKEQLLRVILEDDALGFQALASLGDDDEAALETLEKAFLTAHSEGRQVLQLLLRAEIDGVRPESLLEGRQLPMGNLADWLEAHETARGGGDGAPAGVDPRAFALLIGAAGLGLAAAQPLLSTAVGWEDEDPDEVLRRCIATMMALIAAVVRGEGGANAGAEAPADA